jgi:hypothetical protein
VAPEVIGRRDAVTPRRVGGATASQDSSAFLRDDSDQERDRQNDPGTPGKGRRHAGHRQPVRTGDAERTEASRHCCLQKKSSRHSHDDRGGHEQRRRHAEAKQ